MAEEKLINMGLKSPESKNNENFQTPCNNRPRSKCHIYVFAYVCILGTEPESCTS